VNSTDLNIYLISTDGTEVKYILPTELGVWTSLNIPMSYFTDLGLLADLVHQFKFDGNGDFYADNIYFIKGVTALEPVVAAPTPTQDAAGVVSVYSDAYTDIAGTNLNPNWGQATVFSEITLEGNNTILLSGLNYQGINIGSTDGGVGNDFSGLGFLHIDFWTANATQLELYLISLSSGERSSVLDIKTAKWVSVDIPLKEYLDQGLTLNDIHQYKFVGDGDVYVDNLYFWGTPWVRPDDVVLNGFENAGDIAIGASDFWQLLIDSEDDVNNALSSALVSEVNAYDGVGATQFAYSVANDLGWGGFVALSHVSDAYIDLSGRNYLSVFFRNYQAASVPNSMALRVTLMESSEDSNPANWTKAGSEYYYSFIEADRIFDAPDSGWAEIRIPLQKTASSAVVEYTEGFVRTGWAGVAGNNQLDLDKIVGFGFEFVLVGDWGTTVANDIVDGAIWFDKMTAFYSDDVLGCTNPESYTYNPDATVDDGSCLMEDDVAWVTFEVNMEQEIVSEEGVHIAAGVFGLPGDNPMLDDGVAPDRVANDNVYTHSRWFKNYASEKYTFINGANTNWSQKENIVGQDCAWGEYSDRHFDLGVNDTTITTCFGQCSDDGTCEILDYVSVTFKVNMMDVETDLAGVYMAGGGLGEAGLVMDDSDGDDIWELTLTDILPGADFFWKFRNGPGDGNWGGNWEDGDQLAAEGCGGNQYNDRVLNTDIDLVLPAVCFSSCYPCSPKHDIEVTVSVDMTQETGFNPSTNTPYVFGNFNGWDYISPVMLAETATSGIWSASITAESRDTLDYLFGYGTTFEDMSDQACAVLDPGVGLAVRRLIMPIDTTTSMELDTNWFGSCSGSGSLANDEELMLPKEFALNAFPNPFNPDVTIQYDIPAHENVKIDVVNMLGQHVTSLVETHHSPGHYSVEWNGRNSYGHQAGTGIYFIVVSRASGTAVTKVTLLK
ncbi:MAG: T9SS type A sorting domain-containing protein, partial [Candidatus Marinimicrobia bacterium]|nr:T9SS type A sorting domain-containing protein [Candidatus Neomarinimicrobiota bacterium]